MSRIGSGLRQRLVVGFGFAVACPPVAVGGQAARDSSGVRIVENGNPLSAHQAWTANEEDAVQMGMSDLPSENEVGEYGFVDVGAVVLLSGGGVAVADRGTAEIRLFTDDGTPVESFGRRGSGPQEFQDLSFIGECRSGFLDAYDARLGRVSTTSLEDLGLVATKELRAAGRGIPPTTLRCIEGGWVAITESHGVPPPASGPIRWPTTIEVQHRGAGAPQVLVRTQGDDKYFSLGEIGPLALGRRTVLATSGSLIALGTQDDPQLAVYSVSGELLQSIRWMDMDRRVSRGDLAQYIELWVSSARSKSGAQQVRDLARDYPFPATYPAFGEVLFDNSDRLWVESTPRMDHARNVWMVFGPDGVVTGIVEFPRAFRLMAVDVSRRRAAGVWQDSIGVEHVWILPLGSG